MVMKKRTSGSLPGEGLNGKLKKNWPQLNIKQLFFFQVYAKAERKLLTNFQQMEKKCIDPKKY